MMTNKLLVSGRMVETDLLIERDFLDTFAKYYNMSLRPTAYQFDNNILVTPLVKSMFHLKDILAVYERTKEDLLIKYTHVNNIIENNGYTIESIIYTCINLDSLNFEADLERIKDIGWSIGSLLMTTDRWYKGA